MADEPKGTESEQVEEATPEVEEKPKPARKPRAKKAAAEEPKAEEAVAEEPKAEEAVAEEAPAEEPVAEEAVAEAEAEEKPKPARKPRAKKAAAEEPKEEPKPARRTRKQAPERVVVRAHAKYVRTSARKARLVCDHIRGKDVAEARAILLHTNRAVSEAWSKLLESAVANAAENHSLDGEDLRVAFVAADEGPTLKRFRPRAMGRATKIRKRTSHLSIGLEPKE
jgi:ribosomal protein L22